MEIQENKTILLSDGCKYFILKKFLYEGKEFLFALRLGENAKILVLEKIFDKTRTITDDNEIEQLIKLLFADEEFKQQYNEDVKKFLEIYKKSKK